MAAPMRDLQFSKGFLRKRRLSAYKTAKFDEINEISNRQFFNEYLVPNKPCIFNQSVTESWRSRQDWVQENGTPNFNFLRHYFGEAVVPVANCKQEKYSSHPKQDWTLCQYLDYWEDFRTEGYSSNKPCLYLKDWHFTKAFPSYKAYQTPVYFQSDWLNEFWDTRPLDDYRFVYMGPKGTWTPFHSDVYRSYSWSANICGKKKWIFYPPGCEDFLKDKFGNLIYDITSAELVDNLKYPQSDKVKSKRLEVIQGQGQIIFVPSGWHHQVYNLEDTISINHNWLNGCNIDICWDHLHDNLQSVKREIADLREMEGWEEQCQLILNASAGIDYETFIEMLKVIAMNRLEKIRCFGNKDQSERDRIYPNSLQELQSHIDEKLLSDYIDDIDLKTTSGQKGLAGLRNVCVENSNKVQNQSWSQTSEKVVYGDKIDKQGNTLDSSKILNEKNSTFSSCEKLKEVETSNSIEIAKKYGMSDSLTSKAERTLPKWHLNSQYANYSENDSSDVKNSKSLTDFSIREKEHVAKKDTSSKYYTGSDEADLSEERWSMLFDLCRVQETLFDMIKDKDYKSLHLERERSAEYVYDLIIRSDVDCIT